MELILNYILEYGPTAFLIGLIIITFIGILKLCKAFDWIKNKDVKKLVYYIFNIGLSFGVVALYFTIYKIDFSGYLAFSFSQVGSTTALYAIYENLGLRKLWQMVLSWIASRIMSWFKKNPENKYVKALEGLGLSEEAVERIQCLIKSEITLKEEAEKTK